MPGNQHLMTLILEHLPIGVFVVDPGGVIQYANPAMREVSDLSLESIVGSDILAVESYQHSGMADQIAMVLKGETFRLERFEHISLAGKTSIRNAWGIPLTDPAETRALIFVEDITDAVEAEGRERHLQAQLLQAQKMESIGRLAGGVAHDFNNLLSVILGHGEIATDRLPPEHPAAGNVSKMMEAGDRATGLTRQLLAFSRKQMLKLEVFDLNAAVGGVLNMLRRVLGEDIVIRFKTRGGELHVEADQGQLEQVVMNLATNARDAMPDGGDLILETRRIHFADHHPVPGGTVSSGDYAVLSVTDTGEGMPPEVSEQIFEPFFTTKEVGRGTGLGLATVYGIVTQHGGAIEVASEPGTGSTFTVYLPTTKARPSRAVTGRAIPVRGGTETLLVVEDDDEIRQMIVGSLVAHGYRVHEAASGEEALVVAHANSLDLLLTDVVMPGMNGRELAERLTVIRPGVAVIFMSGYTDGVLARHGVLETGTIFLQKPVTPAIAAKQVRDALDVRPPKIGD